MENYKVTDVWFNDVTNRSEYSLTDTDGKTYVIGVKPNESLEEVLKINNLI